MDNDLMTPLCGAKARSNGGRPCRRLAGPNGRCSNHGGKSTGPKTLKGKESQRIAVIQHGYWSKQAVSERQSIQALIKKARQALAF